jgi:hypothetical protein
MTWGEIPKWTEDLALKISNKYGLGLWDNELKLLAQMIFRASIKEPQQEKADK